MKTKAFSIVFVCLTVAMSSYFASYVRADEASAATKSPAISPSATPTPPTTSAPAVEVKTAFDPPSRQPAGQEGDAKLKVLWKSAITLNEYRGTPSFLGPTAFDEKTGRIVIMGSPHELKPRETSASKPTDSDDAKPREASASKPADTARNPFETTRPRDGRIWLAEFDPNNHQATAKTIQENMDSMSLIGAMMHGSVLSISDNGDAKLISRLSVGELDDTGLSMLTYDRKAEKSEWTALSKKRIAGSAQNFFAMERNHPTAIFCWLETNMKTHGYRSSMPKEHESGIASTKSAKAKV